MINPLYPKYLGRPKIALVDAETTYERLVAAGIPPLRSVTPSATRSTLRCEAPKPEPDEHRWCCDG
jgi:hypothetical protein